MPALAPLVGAVSSVVAGAASFVGSLGIVGQALIGVGLQLAATKLQKKSRATKPVTGTNLDVQYGGDRPREIVLGLCATAGHDVYTNTFGPANKFVSKVFVLSDWRIDGLSRVAVNGEWTALDAAVTDRGQAVQGKVAGKLWIKIVKGALDQPADPYLVSTANPAGRWTAAHRLAGMAYAIVTAEWHDETMNAFPQLLFEVRGAPLYDVRRDTTAGGSGPHRWADPATWEYANNIGTNPIVQAYNYERGFVAGSERLLGKGMPATDLQASAWMAAANVCDEVADGAPRYRSGCVVTAADGVSHADNLTPILEAAGAMLAERVDGDLPIVGAQQPVVATLTDDDLIVGEQHRFQAKRSRTQLANGAFGGFNDPASLWSATAYPPVSNASGLAADRERHAVQIDFETVFDRAQAVRLAEIAVRENRYQASATIVVRPRWMVLEVGDWVRWDSARRGTRIWRVVGRSLSPLGATNARCVTLDLQEVGAGIYDTAVTIPEVTPRTGVADVVYTRTVENFLLVATSVTGANGRVYPALQAQWDAINDLTVREVVVRYWKTADPSVAIEARVAMPATYVLLVEGVLPLTQYTAEARVVTDPPRDAVWSRRWTVTSLAEDLAFELAQLRADIRGILATGAEAQADFEARLQELGRNAALITGQQLLDLGGVSARLIDETTVRQSQTEALAIRTTGVETGIADASAKATAASNAVVTLTSRTTAVEGRLETQASAVTGVQSRIDAVEGVNTGQAAAISALDTRVSAQDGRITAMASAQTGVQATVNDLSASGLIAFKAVATDNDAYARISIQVRAKTSDGWKDSGLFLEASASGSTILARADRFIVTDGSAAAYPFVIQGSVVKLAVARFQQLISDNGRLVINGSAGLITVSDDT